MMPLNYSIKARWHIQYRILCYVMRYRWNIKTKKHLSILLQYLYDANKILHEGRVAY